MTLDSGKTLDVAVVGSGISGLSTAWLLAQRHRVTLFEKERRLGGHTNTVMVEGHSGSQPIDTGFIVYNEVTYPNLTALFAHLGVATRESEMSFAVSLDDGGLEYAGTDLAGLFAQRRNLIRPRFLRMLWDLLRFYRDAPGKLATLEGLSLGAFLERGGYSDTFRDDHLLPMAAAIWSAPSATLLSFPATSFIRFCDNHGLLKITDRPVWRTVCGGSQSYIAKLTSAFPERTQTGNAVTGVRRDGDGVLVRDAHGRSARFDHVVIAAHADESLALLDDPLPQERATLGAFRYSRNRAVLHSDPRFMPKRRAAWCSWNYIGEGETVGDGVQVTYWMNRLQGLSDDRAFFVTLNPHAEPDTVLHEDNYTHPIFDLDALAAQRRLWALQGQGNVWFCGAHFGAGFHEDGLQAGLAVAEAIGGVRRPWRVPEESGRIYLGEPAVTALPPELAPA